MAKLGSRILLAGLLLAMAVAFPTASAQAYTGPGLGLGTLLVVLGVIGSLFLALFSVVWYPLKRMFKRVKAAFSPKAQTEERKG